MLVIPCLSLLSSVLPPSQDAVEPMLAARRAAFGLRLEIGLDSVLGATPTTKSSERQALVEAFHPELFDAVQWAGAAQRAGAGYLLLQARDPLGFCLFDSQGDFDVVATPVQRDWTLQLSLACAELGLPFGLVDGRPKAAERLPLDLAPAGIIQRAGTPLPGSMRALLSDLVRSRAAGLQPLYRLQAEADGSWPEASAQRLAQLGAWMAANGEGLRGVGGNPLEPQSFGWVTCRPGKRSSQLYLWLRAWPADGRVRVAGIGNRATEARVLGSGAQVGVHNDGTDLLLLTQGPTPGWPLPAIAVELDGAPIPLLAPTIEASAPEFVFRRQVHLQAPAPEVQVRFTRDGSDPTLASELAEGPLELDQSTTLRAASFFRGQAVGQPVEASFRRMAPAPAVDLAACREGLALAIWNEPPAGLAAELAAGSSPLEDLAPARQAMARRPVLPAGHDPQQEARRFRGYVQIPRAETWTFALRSSGPVQLSIDDIPIVLSAAAGTPRGHRSLSPGWHPFELIWLHAESPALLDLEWAVAGQPLEAIPRDCFRRDR